MPVHRGVGLVESVGLDHRFRKPFARCARSVQEDVADLQNRRSWDLVRHQPKMIMKFFRQFSQQFPNHMVKLSNLGSRT